jgi:hypothetical protein
MEQLEENIVTSFWEEKSGRFKIFIRKILAEEIRNAEDNCLTGKIVRLINSLNGLHPAVQIRFSNHTEIGNIVNFLREKSGHLSPEDLKILITRELRERGYEEDQISVWTDFLDEI